MIWHLSGNGPQFALLAIWEWDSLCERLLSHYLECSLNFAGENEMNKTHGVVRAFLPLVLFLFSSSKLVFSGGNEILGEIELHGASKIEKTAGVWVDGQYVGFVKELKGAKNIFLLPGEHEIVVRQAGYKDFSRNLVLEPGQEQIVNFAMQKDLQAVYPDLTAEMKLDIKPSRAAVFLEDRFVGYVDQFNGPGQWLLVAPGKHRVKIALPGYRTFETNINLAVNQKYELKTELPKASILQAEPLIKEERSSETARSH
jgi:hypothetical protein